MKSKNWYGGLCAVITANLEQIRPGRDRLWAIWHRSKGGGRGTYNNPDNPPNTKSTTRRRNRSKENSAFVVEVKEASFARYHRHTTTTGEPEWKRRWCHFNTTQAPQTTQRRRPNNEPVRKRPAHAVSVGVREANLARYHRHNNHDWRARVNETKEFRSRTREPDRLQSTSRRRRRQSQGRRKRKTQNSTWRCIDQLHNTATFNNHPRHTTQPLNTTTQTTCRDTTTNSKKRSQSRWSRKTHARWQAATGSTSSSKSYASFKNRHWDSCPSTKHAGSTKKNCERRNKDAPSQQQVTTSMSRNGNPHS